MTDDIVKQVINKDEDAFRRLYEEYAVIVYSTALNYMQNKEEAEEVSQEVFITVFRKIRSFRQESKLSTWIYRITVNTSLNHIKRNKRLTLNKQTISQISTVDFDHPGVLMEQKEDAKLVFKMIDKLPDSQKTAFILSFIEELPRQEVAEIMEVSLKAVEALLQRAKKKLRIKLAEFYPNRRIRQK